MPGQSAGSSPPETNVIPLGRGRRDHTAPGEDRMDATPAYGEPSPDTLLAIELQTAFVQRGRSLTDPDTAEAYDIALQVFLRMVDGAFVKEHLGEAEHALLRRMLEDARQAPELL